MIINCGSGIESREYIDEIYMPICIRTNMNYSKHSLETSSKRVDCLMMVNKRIKTSFSRREYGALFAVKL